jgi:hypothetical protein
MTITDLTPDAGTGIGPHAITLTGTEFPTTPNACRLVMKDAGGATVGQGPLATAETPEAFTTTVTFEIFTPSGDYTAWLVADGVGMAGPTFTLTRTAPAVPAGGTPAGFGVFDRRFGLPNYRGRR